MSQFEIVQTEPEGEGKQPYFLRLVGGNGSDKIVHSENYAHRSGAEGALVTIASTLFVSPDPVHVKWNPARTKGYLMSGGGWMISHAPIHFIKDYEPEAPKVAKKPTRNPAKKAPVKKAEPAKKAPVKRPAKKAAPPVE